MKRSVLASVLVIGGFVGVGATSAKAQGFGYGCPPGFYGGMSGGYGSYYSRGYIGPSYAVGAAGNPGGLLNGGPPNGIRGIPNGFYPVYGGYPFGGFGGYGLGSYGIGAYGLGGYGYGYPGAFGPW